MTFCGESSRWGPRFLSTLFKKTHGAVFRRKKLQFCSLRFFCSGNISVPTAPLFFFVPANKKEKASANVTRAESWASQTFLKPISQKRDFQEEGNRIDWRNPATQIIHRKSRTLYQCSHGSRTFLVSNNYYGDVIAAATDSVQCQMNGFELSAVLQQI